MATLGLTSCGDEAFDVDSVNKQTILVFLPWSGGANSAGLYEDLKANVDSICAGIVAKKGLSSSRVLVFLSESSTSSTLYDLQYDATEKKVNRIPLKTYSDASYNSAEGFAELLNETKQQAEALNYALIIGGHGCGWTYADDWVNYPYLARPRSGSLQSDSQGSVSSCSTESGSAGFGSAGFGSASLGGATGNGESFSGIQFGDNPDKPTTRFFGSVSLKDNSIDVATLAEGIKQSGIKMQYILFDACYMGNVETAYELKDVTNYFIASSSEIMSYGLPYKTLWSYLNSATPSYSSIVSTAVSFHNSSDSPYLNLAAIDCRQMDKLAEVMKEINSKYTLASTVPLDSIQPLDGFSPNLFYDMTTYVDSLYPSGYLKDQYTAQMKLTVKAAQSTEQVFTALSSINGKYIKVKNYCGLTISDPSLHSVATKGREKTGWWKATH